MADYPRSLLAFQRRFPDDASCAAYLFVHRWPEGFLCPGCGHGRFWEHKAKSFTYECRACHRQTSIKAGTVLHDSKLPLATWFWAAFLMATHSNGISALQLQSQLGLGSYKTAWALAAKLRRSMLAPGRAPLQGIVEVDETTLPVRGKEEPAMGGVGRSHQSKMLLAGAIEVGGGGPGPHQACLYRGLFRGLLAGFRHRQHRRRRHRQDRWLVRLRGPRRACP